MPRKYRKKTREAITRYLALWDHEHTLQSLAEKVRAYHGKSCTGNYVGKVLMDPIGNYSPRVMEAFVREVGGTVDKWFPEVKRAGKAGSTKDETPSGDSRSALA